MGRCFVVIIGINICYSGLKIWKGKGLDKMREFL